MRVPHADGYLREDDDDDYNNTHDGGYSARRGRDSEYEGLLSDSSWDIHKRTSDGYADCRRSLHAGVGRIEGDEGQSDAGVRDAQECGEVAWGVAQVHDRLLSSGVIKEDLADLAKRAREEDQDEEKDEENALVC